MHWVLRSLQIWIPESACLLGGRHLVRKSELYGRASKFVHTYSRGFPKSSVRRHALLRKPGSVRIFIVWPHRVFFSLIRTSLGCLGFLFICETSAKARVHFRASGPPNIPKQLVQCAFAWARSVSCVERQRLEFSVASCAAEVLASVFLLVSFLTPPFQGSSRCVWAARRSLALSSCRFVGHHKKIFLRTFEVQPLLFEFLAVTAQSFPFIRNLIRWVAIAILLSTAVRTSKTRGQALQMWIRSF